MRKSSLDKEKQEKNGKTVKKPGKAATTENTNDGENGGGSAATEKLNKNKEEARQKHKRQPQQKGARKALRKAVKEAVKAQSNGIAYSLLDRTAHGDMRGAAIMISLMEPRKKDGSDGTNEWHGPSVAELLEAEPPWDASMENSETGAGGRKPELEKARSKD